MTKRALLHSIYAKRLRLFRRSALGSVRPTVEALRSKQKTADVGRISFNSMSNRVGKRVGRAWCAIVKSAVTGKTCTDQTIGG